MIFDNEHIIRCSKFGINLIVKDNIHNAIAFLSHLKLDHGKITALPTFPNACLGSKPKLILDNNYKKWITSSKPQSYLLLDTNYVFL